MSTPPTIQLHLFFARDSDRAVVLRQGPYKLSRLILWHRDTDTFEDGQWLKHRVYADRCDLSPDGRHFVYFALNGGWTDETKGSYTALSRPPYFTALALFPMGHTWGGGGVFLTNDTYVADGEDDIIGRAEGLARSPERGDKTSMVKPFSAARTHPDYATKDARLYRRRGQELSLIRDFTDMRFSPIRAPYDQRKPGDSGHKPWHPLDGDAP